jgi:hypothetical protein
VSELAARKGRIRRGSFRRSLCCGRGGREVCDYRILGPQRSQQLGKRHLVALMLCVRFGAQLHLAVESRACRR